MPFRNAPVLVRGPKYAAIRAFRSETREDMLQRQTRFLGAGLANQEARLARALRAERQAAASGKSYDLSRHFALARLCRKAGLRTSGTRNTSEPEIAPGEKQ